MFQVLPSFEKLVSPSSFEITAIRDMIFFETYITLTFDVIKLFSHVAKKTLKRMRFAETFCAIVKKRAGNLCNFIFAPTFFVGLFF